MTVRQDDEGLCCLRAIATDRGLQLAGNDHYQRKKWTQENLSQKIQRQNRHPALGGSPSRSRTLWFIGKQPWWPLLSISSIISQLCHDLRTQRSPLVWRRSLRHLDALTRDSWVGVKIQQIQPYHTRLSAQQSLSLQQLYAGRLQMSTLRSIGLIVVPSTSANRSSNKRKQRQFVKPLCPS